MDVTFAVKYYTRDVRTPSSATPMAEASKGSFLIVNIALHKGGLYLILSDRNEVCNARTYVYTNKRPKTKPILLVLVLGLCNDTFIHLERFTRQSCPRIYISHCIMHSNYALYYRAIPRQTICTIMTTLFFFVFFPSQKLMHSQKLEIKVLIHFQTYEKQLKSFLTEVTQALKKIN